MKTARVAAAIAVAAGLGAAAQAASVRAPEPIRDMSRNWAGYAVDDPAGARSFTKVTATWTQPNVSCGSGDRGARFSFWVGLGGYKGVQEGLQQTGVSSDCSPIDNRPEFYAWYEITPAPGTRVKHLAVRAGDRIKATVETDKARGTVVFRLQNRTLGWTFAKRVATRAVDLSSAEWIAEAPAGCTVVRCGSQRLANFGSVRVSQIAVVADGHEGKILDGRWRAIAIHQTVSHRHAYATGSAAGAAPRSLAADGAAFTLVWRRDALSGETPPQQPAAKPVSPLIAGPFERSDR